MTLLTTLRAACTPTLATFDRFTPKDRGGKLLGRDIAFGSHPRQTLDVYGPEGAANTPVIIYLHGGSWASGDKSEYGFVGAAFTSHGFVTVIANYRLTPHDHFPAFVEDAALAVKWTHEHIREFGGDADRIVLVGHSSGAYNAMMVALDQRYLRAAGLDVSPIRGVAGLAGPYDFLPLNVQSAIDAFGHAPDLAATQPINFVRPDAPPVFMGHGGKDQTVRRRNMRSLEEKLKALGVRVETVVYPRIGHVGIMLALSKPLRGQAPVLDDVTAFAIRVTERSRAPAR